MTVQVSNTDTVCSTVVAMSNKIIFHTLKTMALMSMTVVEIKIAKVHSCCHYKQKRPLGFKINALHIRYDNMSMSNVITFI